MLPADYDEMLANHRFDNQLFGAIVAMGVAHCLAHLVLIWLARKHAVWDGWHDLVAGLVGTGLGAGALWIHREAIAEMIRTAVV